MASQYPDFFLGDIAHSEKLIYDTYGDKVSARNKLKTLRKFGRTSNADDGVASTIALFQGSVVNETFVNTNAIDSVVSTNAGDTQTVTIEGHTISATGDLTFVVQQATLNGQTAVTLSTPLARASRLYVAASGTFNSPQAAIAGTVSVYDGTDGETSGVPTTATATKIIMIAGETSSEKCSTSISSSDYLILTGCRASLSRTGTTVAADFELQTRDVKNGGVWRSKGLEITLRTNGQFTESSEFNPNIIVPKNHDVRMVITADAANTVATASFAGYLASIRP